MNRSRVFAAIVAAMPIAGVFAWTQLADAHHPTVSATAECSDSTSEVIIKVASWASDEADRRVNKEIDVLWGDEVINTGEFTEANDYSFTVKFYAPADGAEHTVTAIAIAPFGPNGEYGFNDSYEQAKVTLPTNCTPATTSTVTPTTTTAPDEVKVPTEVLGTVVEQAVVPQPVDVLPSFAG